MRMKFRDIPAGTRFRILETSPWWNKGWYGTKLFDRYVRFHHPSKNAECPKGLATNSSAFGNCADNECVWCVYPDALVDTSPVDFSTTDEGGVV